MQDAYQEIRENTQLVNTQVKDLDKEIDVVQRELDSLSRSQEKTKKVIEVLFNAYKDQTIDLEVSYLVRGAFWKPFYKVDVPLSLENINLVMFSSISQQTGEDWPEVALTISNIIPLRGIGLPRLDSWGLDIARHDYRGGEMVLQKRASMMALEDKVQEEAEYSPQSPEPKKKAEFAEAYRRALPLSFEYELPYRISIDSKDKETILPLLTKTLEGEFFYYAVPRLSPLTFLVCNASADKELLSGYLQVYFAGRFIGKTFLSEKKAGENFQISLGADREVKVKREKVVDKIRETFFGKIERQTVIRELSFKITIENLKDETIKIKVLDTIPVSQTDKIEVKEIALKPKPLEENYQDTEGLMLWDFRIAPKKTKEITINFVITYPKDTPLVGL